MAPQFIFGMHNVSKAYGEKVVLRNINLSFYYGAKIGVVGATAREIDPAADSGRPGQEIDGRSNLAKGMHRSAPRAGAPCSSGTTVRATVRTAMRPVQAPVDRFAAITARRGRANTAEATASRGLIAERHGRAPREDRRERRLGVEPASWTWRSDALSLPPADPIADLLSGGERRRVRPLPGPAGTPACLSSTSRPTTSTRRPSNGSSRPSPLQGTVIVVTHDRYFLDNVAQVDPRARSGHGLPSRGTTPHGSSRRSSFCDRRTMLTEGVITSSPIFTRLCNVAA